ncbi:MAG: hypothetical protein Q7S18_00745 [bacterium]|nr:hypothetical protein [bacterium]
MNQKYSVKIWIFFVNFLLMIIGVLFIKNQEENKLASENIETTQSANPIDSAVLDKQGQILKDREQKLRNANTTPKQIKKIDNTSTTTTTSGGSASSSSGSGSNSVSKSSSKTKTS